MDDRTREGWKERPYLEMGSLLGKGRFGGVYSAVDETDENEYAVKVISFFKLLESDIDFKKLTKRQDESGDDSQLWLICDQAVGQFLLEVQQMRRISSENVVQLIDHWIEGPLESVLLRKPTDIKSIISSLPSNMESSEDTFLYIQMELCQETLEKWIEDRIQYGIRKEIYRELKYGALLQITSGLNDLHNEGVVHCDLEPKNILVRTQEEEITFKIGGLGDSKLFDDESRGLEFQRMGKSDIESLALKVFSFILTKVETVKGPWEFYREQVFVDSIASEDTTYFRGCSCKFLISFLSNEDPHLYEQSLEDNLHDFKTCFRCMYNYWSSDFLSQYENINFHSDILNLRDKVNSIERYIYQIKVNNEADARYSTNIVKGCLKEAGIKVVALEGRKFLDLVNQGQGSIAIDHLKLNKIDLLILLCYSMSYTETLSMTQISDKLDGISVNTLIIACEDMKGKHGVFIDKPTVIWEDLTDQSKTRLLKHKMNLQGRTLVLGEYLKELDTESLRLVLSDSQGKLNIPIGPNSEQSKLPQPYIHRKFQEINSKKEISDTNIILMKNKLVLISDGPGAGKSTVLIQLFQTLSGFDGMWGHVIYLNRFLNRLLEWEAFSVPVATLLFEMLKANLQNGELQTLFETTMEGNTSLKSVLFLDALDEVAPDSYDNVTNILKQLMDKPGISKIVLTTRPHLFTELQKSFEQTAVFLKLVPISHREQIDYIMTVWGVTDDLKAKSCVKEFNQLCGGYKRSPLESPLLLNMLAEHTKTEKHVPMGLREFYSAVVDRKLEVSIEEKLCVKSEGLGGRNEKN
jgi:serine/threonine protein kinase